MSRFRRNMNGFTVVELIVAVALTGIATAAVYKSFSAQQNVYTAQGQVVDLQQNLRAGTDLLVRELRMAGYDPSTRANAGFVTANALTVRFTMNFDDDDDVSDEGEDITYSLFILGGVKCLGRKTATEATMVPVVENVDALQFYYTRSDGTQTLLPTDRSMIRNVTISILARSATREKANNSQSFTTASGAVWTYNDGYRRRFEKITVKCRNMGFKS